MLGVIDVVVIILGVHPFVSKKKCPMSDRPFCVEGHHVRARTGLDRGSRQGRSPRSSPVLALTRSKSTRLNSSHVRISYAVFCLKKKNIDSLFHHKDPAPHSPR